MYNIDLEHTSDIYRAHCTNERQSASSVKLRYVNYKHSSLMTTLMRACCIHLMAVYYESAENRRVKLVNMYAI